MRLFSSLQVFNDETPRSAAMNMALDEALLESARTPALRIYRWDHAALSFGYFGRYEDVNPYESERDVVRRWTGGGIVFHGEDLTYALIIPAADPMFTRSSTSIYTAIHLAIKDALAGNGTAATLSPARAPRNNGGRSSRDAAAGLGGARPSKDDVIQAASNNPNACFANPVRADLMVNGKKVAGAAQRRSRLGLLQQGSIQNVKLSNDFPGRFAGNLSTTCRTHSINEELLRRAADVAEQKYAAAEWLRRR